jgi:acetylornithine/N-succinyldiaminopimelate aminotransferase
MTNALLATYKPYDFTISHGLGDQIVSDDGAHWWDFYGGHCVASTGHSHPAVVAAITSQAGKLLFYSTAGKLAIRQRAAERLISFAGANMASVFFCNSGAEANENALKIARLITGRSKLLSLSGGWHGRSLACLSVTDDSKITEPYRRWLVPAGRLAINDIEAVLALDLSDVAAVLVEPIQSLSGIRSCSDAFLRALRQATQATGTLLIFDEIQTGVGRLGTPFAASQLDRDGPDLITSAKGLASGVPIGAVLMRAEVAEKLAPGDVGSTFGGGPLACAALIATIDAITDEGMMANALRAEQQLRAICAKQHVKVLGRGLLLGVEHAQAAALKSHFYQNHILVGASSDPCVLRLMPPLMLTDGALSAFAGALSTFNQAGQTT